MPEVVSSVHNRVTCSTTTTPMCYREFRSRYMVYEMKATERFYRHIDNQKVTSYSIDFDACCSNAWFVRDNDNGMVKVISHKCNLRWCPICARAKAYRISKALIEKLKPDRFHRLLTLTLKHNETDLTSSSNRLYKCFQRLRKTAKFKKHVSGGVWFYQLVWSMKTLTWHPHLHCVITGKYFKQSEIKTLWQQITGDSYVVDIRFAKNKPKVISYVSRYVSRPVNLIDCPEYEHLALFEAFRSRKLCGSWGRLRGVDLRGSKNLLERHLTQIGSWMTVQSMKNHDGNAALIIDRWTNGTTLPEGVNCLMYDNLIDDIKPYKPRASPDPYLF